MTTAPLSPLVGNERDTQRDTLQLYHEVNVVVFMAKILHELLKPTFLSTHLEKEKQSKTSLQITAGGLKPMINNLLFLSFVVNC